MIEIVFNELNYNTLKLAQKYGEGAYPGGYSFITYYNEDGSLMTEGEAKAAQKQAELEEAKRWDEATPLGGETARIWYDDSINGTLGFDWLMWEFLSK